MLPFFERARALLADVARSEEAAIMDASMRIAESLIAGGVLHVFGTGHSHIAGEELLYRAGGLAPVNAILYPSLMQHEGPVASTKLERLPGLARIIFEQQDLRPGEVVIIVSNSGKNAVPLEFERLAREAGLQTIALTSRAQSDAATLPEGQTQRLYELCDVVIDNGGEPGDAVLEVPGHALRTSGTSTLANAAIVQEIVYQVSCRFAALGLEPPVFKSANLPGGDAWNARLIERYRGRLGFR